MKKLSFLFFSLLAVTVFTSCLNNEEPIDERTLQDVMSTRAIDGDKVVFSQNNVAIKINMTNQTIKFTTYYKNADGVNQSLTTPDMALTPVIGTIYSFSTPVGDAISMNGQVDLSTIMVWYTFTVNDSEQAYGNTHFIFSYADITVTNPDNGNHRDFVNSQCAFRIDSSGEKCTMIITEFAPTLNGGVMNMLTWEGLKMTPTTTGYLITANTAESTMKGSYTISNLKINISDQGRFIDGSFMCNDLKVTISGNLFPTKSL